MKKFLREMIPVIIIAFSYVFMLYIYEPVVMYSANVNDFWFGFFALIKSNIAFSMLAFLCLLAFSSLIYLISSLFKKRKIYDIYLILFSSAFIYLYIQGNFLAGKLPILDGSPIIWSSYKYQSIISIVAIICVLALNFILYFNFKESYKKTISIITSTIIVMILSGLIPILINNKELYIKKGIYVSTTDNINMLSKNDNFIILLVDMLDSKTFDKVLKENNKEDLFKDFTYYPDTLSAYPYTKESIPFILSGKWYEAKESFYKYYNEALNNSSLFKELYKKNYDVNIYEQDLLWNSEKSLETSNIKNFNDDLNFKCFIKQESKFVLFKYLPFSLKKYSKIDTMDYNICRDKNNKVYNVFKSDNKETYNTLDKIDLQNKNYFQFLHIDGGHYPWNINKNFEIIGNGTYENKIESALTVIEKYLDRVKESGQYDNSVIIILADHGDSKYNPLGRQNPSLYIKGFNEKHSKMYVSDKKVSYDDLNKSIFGDLLNGKKSNELLLDASNDRVRRFIWYEKSDNYYEQTLDGHAWETKKLKNTGKVYERYKVR